MIDSSLILGEFRRSVDDRFRLSVPTELLGGLSLIDGNAVLVKERPGCISIWNQESWTVQLRSNIQVIESKLNANRMLAHTSEVQQLGRLLSTRYREISVAGRGRIVIPEGFREFLAVEPNSDVLLVGAAVCVEIWNIEFWRNCLNEQIPQFSGLMEQLLTN